MLMQTLLRKNSYRRTSELGLSQIKIKRRVRHYLKMMKMRMRRSSILKVFMKLRRRDLTRRNADARRWHRSWLRPIKRIKKRDKSKFDLFI